MEQVISIIVGFTEQGLIFGLLALGLYISYKILNFPDLTVDGSFPLGAAITAVMVVAGIDPWLSLVASFLAGTLAGLITGLIHVRLKVSDLLSGILVMTCLYSVNLVITGKANLPFFDKATVFNTAPGTLVPESIGSVGIRVLVIALVIAIVFKLLLDRFLKTQLGLLLRAAGDNQHVVISLAKHPGNVKIMGLAIANGLVAVSGSLLCQQQGFFEVSMGTGSMVAGLASVILGVTLLRKARHIAPTTMVLIGSIVYKGLIALAIALGLNSTLLKLVQGVLFLIILMNDRFFNKERKADHA